MSRARRRDSPGDGAADEADAVEGPLDGAKRVAAPGHGGRVTCRRRGGIPRPGERLPTEDLLLGGDPFRRVCSSSIILACSWVSISTPWTQWYVASQDHCEAQMQRAGWAASYHQFGRPIAGCVSLVRRMEFSRCGCASTRRDGRSWRPRRQTVALYDR